MKVFISWSGDKSRKVGELLDDWLQCVLQAIDPWMSSKDIDRGSLWFSEITDQLKDTSIGIICLTKANKEKPWILFEAGALAKGLSSNRVLTFLIDLVPTDIGDPLAQFNHTYPDKAGLWQLVRTLNSSLQDKALKEKVLEKVFETYFPQFEAGLELIMSETPDTPESEIKRPNDEIMLDVLSATRNIDKRLRSIEYNRQHSSPPVSGIHIHRKIADELTGKLVRENIPPQVIVNLLRDFVPISYLDTLLSKHEDKERYTLELNES
ncbi:toll/interleukin-1 receptor domain-containing protein [Paenibacillus piscarius]|uniref:toll/interleukin-1 receptor domain-containing protein n=1 Tax=Paenibacillus piscarius TaxID=1089681 RepID=UPI001EE96AF8|nr:toll/interleukin-1 receptor domain-containing protein [Paenibacillus piscarius]